MNTTSVKLSFLVLVCLVETSNLFGQVNWIGGTGNWDVAANWSSGLVPDATTDVLISITDNVTIPATVAAVAKSIQIINSGKLTIAATGVLSVDGSTADAISISGTGTQELTNSGTINIGSGVPITGNGFFLLNDLSSLKNEPSGIVNVNNIGADAFSLNLAAGIINKGNIRIGNTASVQSDGFSMDNDAYIDNYPSGTIEVNNIITGYGLYMQNSNVFNQGNILVGNLSSVQLRGISMELGSLYSNQAGSVTSISRIASTSLGQGLFVTSNSSYTNNGMLQIGNNGAVKNTGISIAFQGTLSNSSSGVITVNDITNLDAISIVDDFSTINNSGIINIGNTAAVKRIGIFVNSLALFTNNFSGTINIDNVNGTGSTSGYGLYIANGTGGGFVNSGHINIGTNAAMARYGMNVSNAGDFLNQSTGVIQINNVTSLDAIEVTGTNSIFTNNGTLHIGNLLGVRRTGISLGSSASFTNTSSATLTINNIFGTLSGEGYGMYIDASTLTNNGMVNLGNSTSLFNVGISLTAGSLINQSSGTIQINNIATLDGITENGTGTTVNNSGMIKIGNLASVKRIGLSLFNSSTFLNTAGTLEINSITSVASGAGYGIYVSSSSTITNNAAINIGNISNISQLGVYISGPATITNQASGIINIGRITSFDGIQMANTGALLTNSGQIKIGDVGPVTRLGIFVTGGSQINNAAGALLSINNISTLDGIQAIGAGTSITNNGTLTIGNTTGVYRLGLFMSTSTAFTNGPTGTLTINNILSITANEGIALRLSGCTFTNSNIVQIGNSTAISRFGMVLSSSATLTNQSTGNIQINRITAFSAISSQTSAKIFNNGTIHIGNVAGTAINQSGIVLSTAAEYYNQVGSTLSINRTTTLDAIDVIGAGSKFSNNASINIGNLGPIGEDGIFVGTGGLFENNMVTGIINMANITASSINLTDVNTIFNNRGIMNL